MNEKVAGDAMLHFLSRSGAKSVGRWPLTLPKLSEEIPLGLWFSIVLLSAASGTTVMFLLNTEAQQIEDHNYSKLLAVLFFAMLVIDRTEQNLLISRAAKAVETGLNLMRNKITSRVMGLSLRDIEDLNAKRVIDELSAHYGAISQAAVPLISGVESIVLLLFMSIYLVVLSPAAGLLSAIIVVITVFGYLNINREMTKSLDSTSKIEERHRRYAEGVIYGAKELRLNNKKSVEFESDMSDASHMLGESRSLSAKLFARLISTGSSMAYLMAGGVVFILPIVSSSTQDDIGRIVMAVLFLLSPIGALVNGVPNYSIAKFRLAEINKFETDLDRCLEKQATEVAFTEKEFDTLSLDGVGYAHNADASEKSFAISGLSMDIKRGDIVFITGGNGSGKTTALRTLTGLYPHSEGKIVLNGQIVSKMPSQEYRNVFASVFADFYIFPKPYTLGEEGREKLREWLKFFEIEEKLSDKLTELHPERLSTGQRKRLALALALAEERPVLILDEWAADQDPETRERFYHELLPYLKTRGITIIAVTHDDKYFNCADRRYHMTEGQIEANTV